MKRKALVIVAIVFVLVFSPFSLKPHAQFYGRGGCLYQPMRPVVPPGCLNIVAQCIVEAYDNTRWQWVCVTGLPPI